MEVDEELVVPDRGKTLREGAMLPWTPISSQYYPKMLNSFVTQQGLTWMFHLRNFLPNSKDKC
ncbi:hypothetical protein, partial [Coprococcus eutactus]|uniref:hypothetical protein n=1 Tax=Coprococcus eutactus TaxID=33043 RepID=UPI00210E2008